MFTERNYSDMLKTTTNYRLLYFFIWKFVLMIIFYYLFTKYTQTSFNLTNIIFHFRWSDIFTLFFFTSLADYVKYLVFTKYENYVSYISFTLKLLLEPNINTIFMFVNSALAYINLYTLESIISPKPKNKE
jgi:hypothetical protein